MRKVKDVLDKLQNHNIRIQLNENGSLKLIQPKNSILTENLVKEIQECKQEITFFLSMHQQTSGNIIPIAPKMESYPLSSSQKRMWIQSQLEESSISYNLPFKIELNDIKDISLFIQSINEIIKRHEILRTVFKKNEFGDIRQWIIPNGEFKFKIKTYDFRSDHNKNETIEKAFDEDRYKPFNLEHGPLIRVFLFQISEEGYIFYYNIHHIISDAWSRGILAKEALHLYSAFNQGIKTDLPKLRIQYKDYAVWQNLRLTSENFREKKEYWLERLSGELPVLDLPFSKVRPKIKSRQAKVLNATISQRTLNGIKSFIQEYSGSPFMYLLSVLNVLIYKYSGMQDIIIGTSVAEREHKELENQIGFYINTLPLRNRIYPEKEFVGFYKMLKNSIIKDFEFRMYPFDRIVEDLKLKTDLSRSAIFDIGLVMLNANEEIPKSGPIQVKKDVIIDLDDIVSEFDIMIYCKESEGGLLFSFVYNNQLYEKEAIVELVNNYKNLLDKFLDNPRHLIDSKEIFIESSHECNAHNQIEETDLSMEIHNKSISYTAPATDIEKELEAIWSDILGIQKISINDNFFELGGNSISVVAVLSEIEQRLSIKIFMSAFFEYSTIHELGKYIQLAILRQNQNKEEFENLNI
ncbi:condensation domain-containing protein [Yeosuana marina]|uniref:condensation domain-containing protein n=1 Tax=Yeosuana marina TaxID=1565536 RepID=UPI0030C7ADE2